MLVKGAGDNGHGHEHADDRLFGRHEQGKAPVVATGESSNIGGGDGLI